MKMNSEYEALIEEHCENCYYRKNGVCAISRRDMECDWNNLRHDLQELDLLRKLQKEHANVMKIIKKKGLSNNEIIMIEQDYHYEDYKETMEDLYYGDEDLPKWLKTEEEYDLLRKVIQ